MAAWKVWLWGFGPAAAAALVVLYLWPIRHFTRAPGSAQPRAATSAAALTADDVEIDHRLVAVFDAIAQSPGREPVRYRCRQWIDDVRVRDAVRGVSIQQSTPRLEVVPVRFETD